MLFECVTPSYNTGNIETTIRQVWFVPKQEDRNVELKAAVIL